MNQTFARKNLTVLAALTAAALAATPMVMGASRALATSEAPAAISQTVAIVPVEVGAIRTAPASEPCRHKVRVVYSGYGTSSDGCAAH